MMTCIDLQTLWFLLIGVLFTGYVILDGFDLGAGILHLSSKTDIQRRTILHAIGPVWDGNEVWLITGGGALFAAFPVAYATTFSGFYLAFMLLLLALIMRAVSIEMRNKQQNTVWRKTWDILFSAGSILASILFGVAITDLALGLPLDQSYHFTGNFLTLLPPYAILGGLVSLSLFAVHGGLYLIIKTEGELQHKLRQTTKLWAWVMMIMITAFLLLGIKRLPYAPTGLNELWQHILAIAALVAVLLSFCLTFYNKEKAAFICTSSLIVILMGLFASRQYPNLIPSSVGDHHITIYNASSSPRSLYIMALIAAFGMPIVIAYTIVIYRIFRGKVRPDETSY